MNVTKEPWFYGCLSWLIPGISQFYARRPLRGLLFLLSSLGGGAAAYYMLGTTRFLGLWQAWSLMVFAYIVVPALATWDSVHFAKRQQLAISQKMPDHWFAVFLSLILGLFGYAYLRKWKLAGLWVILAILGIMGIFLIKEPLYAHLIIFSFLASVPIHVYTIASNKSQPITEKAALSIFTILILVTFLAVVVRPYVNRTYGIWPAVGNSGSMLPTLKVGERVVVNNFIYFMSAPESNDIIVIKTNSFRQDSNALESAQTIHEPILTKRIIAAGGDIIEVNDGMVRVNGTVRKYYNTGESKWGTTHWKNLLAQKEPYRVPEGRFFVMGDNINNSFDSRYFGAVPREAIIGKVVKVYWPLKNARTIH